MSHSHDSKALDTRLATVEGSIAAIRRMLADGRPCEELLLQLKAAESSINKISKLILKDHFEHCVKEGIENGDEHAIESFSNSLDQYMK